MPAPAIGIARGLDQDAVTELFADQNRNHQHDGARYQEGEIPGRRLRRERDRLKRTRPPARFRGFHGVDEDRFADRNLLHARGVDAAPERLSANSITTSTTYPIVAYVDAQPPAASSNATAPTSTGEVRTSSETSRPAK